MRVHMVTKAQAAKAARNCEVCRKPVEVGDPYKWIKPRHGSKRVRCSTCPTWQPSEMTTSKMATAMAAQEDASTQLQAMTPEQWLTAENEHGNPVFDVDCVLEDVGSLLSDCATEAGNCRDEYEEGLDNMPEQLRDSPTGELIQEKMEALETWQSELEDFDSSAVFDAPEREVDEEEENYLQRWTDAAQEFVEEVVNEAQEVIDGLEA